MVRFGDSIYATFAGPINQDTVPKFIGGLGILSQQAKEVHLLLQSTGGTVADGIAVYNFLKSYPIDLSIYNAGSISSIAVHAYLGAAHRYASKYSAFMIHKSTMSPQTASSLSRLRALADALVIEDQQSESLLRANTKIPPEKWELHAIQDVMFTAEDAVKFEIANEIREWAVPAGFPIWNLNAQ